MTAYFFDPDTYPTETAWAGATARQSTSGYSTTVTVNRASPWKDRVLRITTLAGGAPYLQAFDSIDGDASRANVEILTCFRFSTSSMDARAVCRGSTSGGNHTGVYFFARDSDNTVQIEQYSAGVNSGLVSASYTLTTGIWYWMRCRADGGAVKLRIWDDGTTEPTTWNAEATATVTAAGWVGLSTYHASGGDIDWALFSCATGSGATPPAPVTRSDYRAWLARDGQRRCVLAEVGLYSYPDALTWYWTNQPFRSAAYDSPASTAYEEVILSAPRVAQTASELFTGRSTVSVGALAIAYSAAGIKASNGSAYNPMTVNIDGRPALILLGDASWARVNFRPLIRGVALETTNTGADVVELSLRDASPLIDLPVETDTIGSGDYADVLLPTCVGDCRFAEPVLEDAANLVYRVHSGALDAIDAVYDYGLALQQDYAGGDITIDHTTDKFTLASHGWQNGSEMIITAATSLPTGLAASTTYYIVNRTANDWQISETVGGSVKTFTGNGTGVLIQIRGYRRDLTNGKLTLVSTPVGPVRVSARVQFESTVADNVNWLLKNSAGLTGRIDNVSIGAHASDWKPACGIYVRDSRTTFSVVDELITSSTVSIWSFSRDGLFYLATPEVPIGTARMTITADMLLECPTKRSELLPVESWEFASGRVQDPITTFAGAVSVADQAKFSSSHMAVSSSVPTPGAGDYAAYHLLAGEKVRVDSLWSGLDDYNFGYGLPEAQSQFEFFRSHKNAVWSLRCTPAVFDLRLGDLVTVANDATIPFLANRSGYVLRIEDNLQADEIRLDILVINYAS